MADRMPERERIRIAAYPRALSVNEIHAIVA